METKPKGTTIDFNIGDPESVRAVFQKLFDEVNITQSVLVTLAPQIFALMAERDLTEGTSPSIEFAGKRRQDALQKIKLIREKLGESEFLSNIEQLCGRNPLRAVD